MLKMDKITKKNIKNIVWMIICLEIIIIISVLIKQNYCLVLEVEQLNCMIIKNCKEALTECIFMPRC